MYEESKRVFILAWCPQRTLLCEIGTLRLSSTSSLSSIHQPICPSIKAYHPYYCTLHGTHHPSTYETQSIHGGEHHLSCWELMGTSSSSKPRVVAPTKPSPEVELENAWSIGCCHRRFTYATWDCTTEGIAQRKAAPVEPFRVRFGRVSWQLRCRKDRGKRKERNLERAWRF